MKLSILICSYSSGNQKFVDQCMSSLDNISINIPIELVCVSSGDYKTKFESKKFTITQHHSDERWHYPLACSNAYSLISNDSTHILLLNDDTIVTKNSIQIMVNCFKDYRMENHIINPASNCDNYYLYYTPFIWGKDGGLFSLNKQQWEYHEIVNDFEYIKNIESPIQNQLYINTPYNCFYATMMSRKLWDDVGGIDPYYKTGWDDHDFCLRAKQKGYNTMICMSAFIFHYSGASSKHFITRAEKEFNVAKFNKKFNTKYVEP